ncbi:MAG: acyl-CoA dehydrogenase family protein [Acidimicrobiia bacterium]|nr:acyl-CoA dehydrogenase family protein [Acidimicrobiia bacterium]
MSEDTDLTESEADAFRGKCRAFLEEHATGIPYRGPDPRGDQSLAAARTFQKALAAAGLAGLTYPVEYGGQGLTKAHERIYREEYAKFPDMTFQLTITHGMCLPMLAEYGSPEHKERFLAKNISAEELWCQMFSEPGAGSDVASLQTRAELDGEEWVINGQKVWTTLAHQCDYGIAIARTDPTQPKHAGISMFILDMRAPGVEIRPIHQIDGGTHFNEVFFTDVRIPKDWLIGDLNNGWNLATSMLMYERVAIGSGATSGVSTTYADRLVEEARKLGRTGEPVLRQKLMRLYSEEFAKSLVSMRTRAELQAGKTPGPGGSLGKLHGARISRLMRDLTIEVVGLETDAWVEGDKGEQWGKSILASFQASIAGGTDEIQKNIIGDRVLGLPRDISVDKGVAFNELKVGTQG